LKDGDELMMKIKSCIDDSKSSIYRDSDDCKDYPGPMSQKQKALVEDDDFDLGDGLEF